MLSHSEQVEEPRIEIKGIRTEGDTRLQRLLKWLDGKMRGKVHSIEPASSDASFRRYFRLNTTEDTLIAMDAPPEVESIDRFVRVCRLFEPAGVHVPEIVDFDLDQGFMLLGDLGSISYLSRLDPDTVDKLYRDALDVLMRIRDDIAIDSSGLPDYDRDFLLRELNLFEQWFLLEKLAIEPSQAEFKMLEDAKNCLVDAILEQPKVVVHRDFHSRNLMVLKDNNPGVLDFQDAVVGPLTYDLVSLLRDCYVVWPDSDVDRWVRDYFLGLDLRGVGFEQFYRWFDLTGLQRHMKAVGIFSRLDIRDGKPGYLADIPRTLGYIRMVSKKYTELSSLHDFLATRVAEQMQGF